MHPASDGSRPLRFGSPLDPRHLSSANLFEFVPRPMAEMHAAISVLAPLLQRAGRIFASISANGGESRRFRADWAVFSVPKRRPALAKPGPLWQGSARLEGALWADSLSGARCRSSVVEHSIGNGEVDSSILSGSTIPSSEVCMNQHSRGTKRLSFALVLPSSVKRAQGRPGAGWHPRSTVRV